MQNHTRVGYHDRQRLQLGAVCECWLLNLVDFFVFPFNLDFRPVPAGVTLEEGHTGFLIHLPSAVLALIFIARRIQRFLSLVDREVEFRVGPAHAPTFGNGRAMTSYIFHSVFHQYGVNRVRSYVDL